jgi:V-type H+-transporting ATPase subunit F
MASVPKGKELKIKGSLAFAVIGDEPTLAGLLLSGLGERHPKFGTNFLLVEKDTTRLEIENKFKSLISRPDIGIIMINQHIAEDIRELITAHQEVIPTVLEIPSKDYPYDPEKDSVLISAARKLYGSDNAAEKLKF